MRVLLIADDTTIVAAVEMAFLGESLVLDRAEAGEDALQQAKLYDYDALLVDLDLRDSDGRAIVRKLRAAQIDAPILAIARDGDVDIVVEALGLGADDCVAKPFHHRELVARLRTIVRRANGHAEPTIRTGKLALDLGGRVATVAGRLLHLTRKEYDVLELLSLRKGRALEKDFFLNHLYDGLDEPEPKIVDVFICHLRKKLAKATGGEHYIETVWGRGYMMRDPEPCTQACA